MTMDPNAPQQPGFLSWIGQGLGNLFSGYQEAPQVGGATDPFSGLSRNQRMLLGFSALRDAAASLEGRDSDYFNRALGGFEQARERERLRQQGLFQNQVQGAQALALIQQQIILGQRLGQDVSGLQAMADQIQSGLMGGFGATPTAGAIPTGGVVQPTGIGTALPAVPGYETPSVTAPGGAETARPTPGVVMDADGVPIPDVSAAEEQPIPPSVYDPLSFTSVEDIRAAQAELRQQATELSQRGTISVGGYTDDPTAQIAAINSLIDDLDERAADIVAAQQEQEGQQEQALRLQPSLDAAMAFIASGITDTGDPIYQPLMQHPAGQLLSQFADPREYGRFVGAIERIAANMTFENLGALRASGALSGTVSDADLRAAAALTGSLDPENPGATFDTLVQIYEKLQIPNPFERATGAFAPTEDDISLVDRYTGGQ